MSDDPGPYRNSRLSGLDSETSLFARMGSTLTLLTIGAITGLIYLWIGSELCQWPAWGKSVGQAACDTVGLFFAVGLVYVWWRPPWLRRLYLYFEDELSRWFWFLAILGPLLIVAALVIAWVHRR